MKNQKLKIKGKKPVVYTKIIVQGLNESATEFSRRINFAYLDFLIGRESKILLIQFTTAANGRQTCNIVYMQNLKN